MQCLKNHDFGSGDTGLADLVVAATGQKNFAVVEAHVFSDERRRGRRNDAP
jgi:hypothetical protein